MTISNLNTSDDYEEVRNRIIKYTENGALVTGTAGGTEDERIHDDGNGNPTFGYGTNLAPLTGVQIEAILRAAFPAATPAQDDAIDLLRDWADGIAVQLTPVDGGDPVNRVLTAQDILNGSNGTSGFTELNALNDFVVNDASATLLLNAEIDGIQDPNDAQNFIVPSRDDGLTGYLEGNNPFDINAGNVADSNERAALFSLYYNSQINEPDETLLGRGLLTAIANDDRAEAWFEIRFNSANPANPLFNGFAKRRLYESEVFNLYEHDHEQQTLENRDLSYRLIFRMFNKHESKIEARVGLIDALIDEAERDYDLTGTAYLPRNFEQTIEIAKDFLSVRYLSLDEGAFNGANVGLPEWSSSGTTLRAELDQLVQRIINGDPSVQSIDDLPLLKTLLDLRENLDNIFTAATSQAIAGDNQDQNEVAAHTVDRTQRPSSDDLIFGDNTDPGTTDFLNGGAGDDFFVPSLGRDEIDGGEGIDTVSYAQHPRGVVVDLSRQIGDDDTLESIEIVIGSAFADRITGDDNDNLLIGGDGANRLWGGRGDDIIIGGHNDDIIDGGLGRDYLDGGDSGADIIIVGPGDIVAAGDSNDRLYWGRYDPKSPDEHLLNRAVKTGWAYHPDDPVFQDSPHVGRDGTTYEVVDGNLHITLPSSSDPIIVLDWEPGDYGIRLRNFVTSLSSPPKLDVDLTLLSTGTPLAPGGAGFALLAVAFAQLAAHDPWANFRLPDGSLVSGWYYPEDLPWFDSDGDGQPDFDGNDNTRNGTDGDDEMGGTSGDDKIVGGGGSDSLSGGGGRDFLLGGIGGDLLKGEAGEDQLEGGAGADELRGGEGDDRLLGGDGDDTLAGGAGDDFLSGGDDDDTYLFNLGDGQDTLYERGTGVLFFGSIEVDTLAFGAGIAPGDILVSRPAGRPGDLVLSIAGTSDSVTIDGHFNFQHHGIDRVTFEDGTVWSRADLEALYLEQAPSDGADSIFGFDGADRLAGGLGDDRLEGGEGDDTYAFNLGDGQDEIRDIGGKLGEDRLVLGPGITAGMVSLSRPGAWHDLTLTIGAGGDQVVLLGQFSGLANGVASIVFDDGTVWDWAYLAARIVAESTTSLDDTIYGTAGDDNLLGGAGNDTLIDGGSDDRLEGGTGDDRMVGGEGDDTYVYNLGDGQDTIYDDGVTLGNIEEGVNEDWLVFGAGIGLEDLRFAYGGEGNIDLIITIAGGGGITIEKYAQWRGLIEDFLFDDGSALYWTQVNELAALDDGSLNEISGTGSGETLNGTAGGDRILAGDGADTVGAGAGQDVLFGGAGNDTLDGGAGRDWIFGGDGDDILRSNAGGSSDHDLLSGGRGADTLEGGAGRDRLFGDEGDDDLTGGDGQDFLDGGAGDDRLAGGTGSDRLVGGSGSDTYVYNLGDGLDTIDAGRDKVAGDLNTLELDVAPDAVSLAFEGADLVISFPASGNDRLTVKDFLGAGSLDRITFSDTTVWQTGEILAQALSATAAGETPAAVDLGDGRFAIYGGQGDDQLNDAAGNDGTLYLFGAGDGQDTINDAGGADDTLLLAGGIAQGDVVLSRVGSGSNDLRIALQGGSDQVLVTGQFLNPDAGIDSIQFEGGTVWSEADIRARLLAAAGTAAGETILGFDDGDDVIRGGAGDDDLRGGLGNDVYLFGAGDGADTILDADLTGNFENDTFDVIRFDAGIAATDVIVERFGLDPNDLVLRVDGTGDRITVDDQFASPAIGIERVEFDDGTVWSEAQIRQRIIDAEVTSGNDTLLGFDGEETFDGGAGNDTLLGGEGDDHYIFESGDGQDIIEDTGSSGGDRLTLGSGIAQADVTLTRNAPDGADVTLTFAGGSVVLKGQFGGSAGVGIQRIVFTDGGEWSAAELQSRFLAAAATDGNDEIYGFAGEDNLAGGLGDDLLDGGAGADSYSFGLGDGQDVIDDSGPETGVERLDLGEGIVAQDLVLQADPLNGDDLLITFRDGADQITVKNHLGPAGPKLGTIAFADGTAWDATAIAAAIANTAPTVAQAIAAQTAFDDNGFFFLVPEDTFADAGDSLTLTATLENGDPLPAWLSFNGAVFNGTPTDGDLGALRVKVVATDSFGTSTETVFDLTVENSNDAPFSTQVLPTQSAVLDAAFSYTLPAGLFDDADAGDAAALTYAASLPDGSLLPAWLSFDAATQTFSGTPVAADAGPLIVLVQAIDPSGATAAVELGLLVGSANAAPTAGTPIGVQTAEEDQGFFFSVPDDAFADADLQDRLTFSAGLANGDALPSWLTFENGVFSGTPGNDDVGVLSVKVTATDLAGATAEATFDLTVANINDAPETDVPLGSWAVYEDESFAYDLPSDAFRDDDVGDTLTLTATLGNGAALPDWLTFDGARLSGSPDYDAVGAYTVTITATDTAGARVSTDIMVVVLPVNDAPEVVNPVQAQTTNQYEAFSFILPINTFRDVDSDGLGYTVRLAGGDPLPDWLSFDPLTRTFSGTPGVDAVGSFEGSRVLQIEVTADDGDGGTVSMTFDLTVVSPNPGQQIIGTVNGEDLLGTIGPDLIDGREGNDRLIGKEGIDTYLFDVGYGEDTIAGSHKNAFDITVYGVGDILRFGSGITTENITVEREGADSDSFYRQNLVLGVAGTNDRITVELQFDSRLGQGATIAEFHFDDGTVWTADEVMARFLVTTLGDDVLAGGGGADTLIGGEGNDILYGLDGEDLLDGGAGDDELYGSSGDDIYVFDIGYGHDKLFDANNAIFAKGFDTLKFGAGIRIEDMVFTRDPNDPNASGAPREAGSLLIEIEGTDDSLRIYDQFLIDNGVSHGVDRFEFADGTVMTREEFEEFVFPGNIIQGTSASETLFGTTGDETLIGGQGDDTIYGEEGDDVYVWNLGDGNDVISEFQIDSFDILRLGPGIGADDISLSHVGDFGTEAAGYYLFLTVVPSQETIEIRWAFDYVGFTEVSQASIDLIAFDDGTVWDHDFLVNYFLTGTPDADVLQGFSERRDDLDGGLGDDILIGRSHHDTYYFGLKYGTDYIFDHYDSLTEGSIGPGDRIVFHEGIRPEDIRITRVAYDLHPVDEDRNQLVVDTKLEIVGTMDSLIIRGDEFYRDHDWITQVVFNEDGTNWSAATLRSIYLAQSETDGDDTIVGFEAADTLRGGLGNDTLDGGRGNDVLRGGAGDDILFDYRGNDALFGDEGNDTLIDSEGDDSYFGGLGDDTFDTRAEVTSGTDIFKGGGGTDVVLFSGNFADYSFFQEADGALRVGNTILYQVEVLRFDDGDVQAASLFPGNNPPNEIELSSAAVDENAANGTLVGIVTASDPDPADTLTLSLINSAGGRFALDPASGQLTVADASLLDFEAATSHTIVVRVTDSTGFTYTQSFKINVNDVNEAPSGLALSNASVDENAAAGALVGTATADDPDAAETLSFTLMDDAGGRFAIDAASGEVTVTDGSLLDFEAAASHSISVRVTDSVLNSYTEVFAISLNDVNESPSDLTLSNSDIDENPVAGALVGTVVPSDPDAGETFTFTLTEDAGGRFSIDAASGELTVADAGLIDFETAASHTVSVQIADSANNIYIEDFTIVVNDINEAPGNPVLSGGAVDENAANGTWVGVVSAVDPDAGDTLSYLLTDDAEGRFAIDASTGVVTVANGSLLDFETSTSHDVTVRATDSGGLFVDQTLTITVNDLPDGAPPAIIPSDLTDLVLWYDPDDSSTVTDATGDGLLESLADLSGRGNGASALSGTRKPFIDPSGIGSLTGLVFDGIDDAIRIGDSNDLNLSNTTARTLSLVFETGADITSRQVIYEEGGGNRGLNIYIENGELHITGWNVLEENWGPLAVSQAIGADEVHSASLVFDGALGSVAGYVDGQLIGSQSAPDAGTLYTHNQDIGLGAMVDGGRFADGAASGNGFHFTGKIGETVIYNRALDATELTQIHNYLDQKWAAAPNPGPFDPSAQGGLVLWFDPTEGGSLNDTNADQYLESVDDLSGRGNDGSALAAGREPVIDPAGINGLTALLFDGTDDAIRIGDTNDLNLSDTSGRTLSLVFETGADVTGRQVIYEEGGGNRGLNIYIENGELHVTGWNVLNENWGPLAVSQVIGANEVHSASLVFDGSLGSVAGYLDGQLIGSQTAPDAGTLYTHNQDIGLGAMVDGSRFADGSASGNGFYFEGKIGETAIYNRALDTGELTHLHDYLTEKWQLLAGTSGNDTVVGTAGDDHLVGLAGDDTILGRVGSDTLDGGVGADTLIGDGPGRGLELNGTGHVRIENFTALPTSAFTIEVEFSTSDTVRDGTLVSYAYGGGGQANEIILYDYKALQVTIGNQTLATGLSFNDGENHRLTVTWDSGDGALQVYDNGVLAFSGTLRTGYSLHTGGIMVLGQEQDAFGGGFQSGQAVVGALNTFKIWNSALTATDVAAGAASDSGTRVVDFQFDEGAGSQTVDVHAGTTAELVGGVSWQQRGKGADILEGGAGNDLLTGGAGDDVFVFADGHGQDQITDFDPGSGYEVIDLDGVSTVNDFAGLTTLAAQVGDDTVIDFGSGDSLTLQGVAVSDLRPEDFRFTRTASEGGDELLGTAGSDLVDGLGGDDVIRGLGGADELNGGTGADHLIGDAAVRGVSLDGTGHVRIENFTALPTTAFTIEVEFSTSDTVRDGTLVSYAYGGGGQANEIILYDYKALQVTIGNNTIATGLSFNDGETHRLTVTWDSSDGALQVYDNGAIAFNGTLQASYSLHTGGIMVLGQEQDSFGGGFQSGQAVVGEIYAFNIWDSALSWAEVEAGKPSYPATTVAEFQFDEGNGSVTTDSHAGLSAQLMGGVTWSDGDAGDDLLQGGEGNDTLEGGRGNDTLEGGLGNDVLNGDAGDDLFIFKNGDGQDTINDLETSDSINVSDFGFADYAALSANFSQIGADVLIQLDADDSVTLVGVNLAELQEGQFVI